MITGAQIRAARALIRWTAEVLAQRSRLGVATVRRAESTDEVPNLTAANAAALRAALEAAGIEFVNGDEPGVKIKRR
jgi:transcriptional regulator with XRE-family HTH domain